MIYRRVVINIEQSVFDRAANALAPDRTVAEAVDTAIKLLFYQTDGRKVYVDHISLEYEK